MCRCIRPPRPSGESAATWSDTPLPSTARTCLAAYAMSSGVCASDTNAASNCEGMRHRPWSGSPWKKTT